MSEVTLYPHFPYYPYYPHYPHCSSAGLSDYLRVDILGQQYKSNNCGAETSPNSPNRCDEID